MDFERFIDSSFRGCCMVTRNGEVLHSSSAGYSDLANEVPNTLETKFATASAGKVFVATAILQLIEKNLLHFGDTLGELLDFSLNGIDPDVMVEQLLTHTAGVPDYFDESIMDEYEELWRDYPNYKIRSNMDLLPLFIDKPMLYPKGTKFQYNNTGFVLLAIIIEKITSLPFDDYLKANIFDVCHMNSTGYYELDRLPAKCANNYIFDEDSNTFRTNVFSVDAKGTGAGGAFTTVGDISSFWNNLLSYRLLSVEMTNAMLSCHSGNEKDGYYGYGIWLKKDREGLFSPYFQGCDPGVSFISAYDLAKNMSITLVSNYCNNVWKIMRNIRENMLSI